MHFNLAIISTVALMAGQFMGAPVETSAKEPRDSLIANDPYFACGCPNNCDHDPDDSCKFHGGPSDTSEIIEGRCVKKPDGLECIAAH